MFSYKKEEKEKEEGEEVMLEEEEEEDASVFNTMTLEERHVNHIRGIMRDIKSQLFRYRGGTSVNYIDNAISIYLKNEGALNSSDRSEKVGYYLSLLRESIIESKKYFERLEYIFVEKFRIYEHIPE